MTIDALSDAPTIQVLDAFTSGGNQGSLFRDDKNDSLEFTDSVTYSYKKHTIKLGVRADAFSIENINRTNFGGTYTFASLEQYRNTLLGLGLARPAQFSINRGDPFVGFSQWEMGWFAQDDWRVSNQLTLSYGLRHEFQTNLQDKLNFAPRVGVAWSDKKRTSTFRFGGGCSITGWTAESLSTRCAWTGCTSSSSYSWRPASSRISRILRGRWRSRLLSD